MNWELQLAAGLEAEESGLLSGAAEAGELVRLQRYGPALEVLWEHLLAVPRKRCGRQRAFLLLHMGHVYRHWMIDVAFKFFRDARELARGAGFDRGEMVAECSLGMVYLDWHEPEWALAHFDRGLEMSWACSGPCWQRDVLSEVVECTQALGRSERARRLRQRLDRLDKQILEDLWGRPEERHARAVAPRRAAREKTNAGTGETSCWS